MAASQYNTGPLALGQIGALGLFNDTQQGEWLVVWDVELTIFANPPGTTFPIVDATLGSGFTNTISLIHPSAPLVSSGAALSGFCVGDRPLVESGKLFFSSAIPPAGYHWPHDWPFCAIQPGFSCTFYSDANPYYNFGLSIVWEVVAGDI